MNKIITELEQLNDVDRNDTIYIYGAKTIAARTYKLLENSDGVG